MIWLNENREKIKTENPGIKPTEVAKMGGEMWGKLTDKKEWDEKAGIEKAKYVKAMEEYKASGGGTAAAAAATSATSPTSTAEKRKNKTDNSTAGSGTGFKSKEYIESDGSSSGDDKKKSKKVRHTYLGSYLFIQLNLNQSS